MDADGKQFATLFPRFKARGEQGLVLLDAELERQLQPEWNDPGPVPSRPDPDRSLIRKIESAQGYWAERFAFCQTMPLDEFLAVAEKLRSSGYRTTRFRPYAVGRAVWVAAVWTRDTRDWRLAHDLSAEAMRKRQEAHSKQAYQPVDVASYRVGEQDRYAALWVKAPASGSPAYLEVGLDRERFSAKNSSLWQEGYGRMAYTVQRGRDGTDRFSAVWLKRHEQTSGDEAAFDGLEADYCGDNYLGDLQVDVRVDQAFQPDGNKGQAGKPDLHAASLDRRCVAVWQPSIAWTSVEVHGQSPAEHLVRCRDLVVRGYRPAAISVTALGRPDQLVAASVWHRPTVAPDGKDHLAQRQANAAVALLRLGREEKVCPLLKHSPDPGLRSYLIHRVGPLGADPGAVLGRLTQEKDVSSRRALILSLGEFGREKLPDSARAALVPRLLSDFRNDPDPGIHGAVAWLLRQWGQGNKIKEIEQSWVQDLSYRAQRFEQIRHELAKGATEAKPQWYVNGQRQTFVVLPGPVEFLMGLRSGEGGSNQRIHRRRINRNFALAAMPVTREQFERFRPNFSYDRMRRFPDADCPITGMTWYEAAEYCNWLSQEEGLPETEWCYKRNSDGRYEEGMTLAANYLSRTGYRLPTEAEWEYACQAGAVTHRSYGESDQLLEKYVWYAGNSQGKIRPVGRLKPNDWGFFDLLGNIFECCQNLYTPYDPDQGGKPTEDREDTTSISDRDSRTARGSMFVDFARGLRSAQRNSSVPGTWYGHLGFRPARTVNLP
jgi:formylglycine-generating enzyme required for sulfatase activity